MKTLKRLFASICCISVVMTASMSSISADNISADADASLVSGALSNFISFDEYLEKYGTENVIVGFNRAAAINRATLFGIGDETASVTSTNTKNSLTDIDLTDNTVPNDLFLSLMDGEFLGLEVIGVSDVAPGSSNFYVKVKDVPTPTSYLANSVVSPTANIIVPGDTYNILYSDTAPDQNAIALSYEEKAGSYLYKYSYAFDNEYKCTTEITFSDTVLKSGTQSNNMYTYIAALSSTQGIDFGLMANPSADNRNKGMYACINPQGANIDFDIIKTEPVVYSTSIDTANNTVYLENAAVKLELTINNGTVDLYMERDGVPVIFDDGDDIVGDNTLVMSGLVSGQSGTPLTFLQAMSCVEANGNTTDITSGACFTNVTFANTTLYSTTNGQRPFKTFGPATYYVFVCQPSKVSLRYNLTNSSETISINYN